MTVRANKPAFNIREKLKELTHNIGLKGRELMSAATAQEARDLVSAGRKNIVINGNMMISQRYGYNNPQTVSNERHLDRFIVRDTTSGTLQVRQSPASGSPFDNVMELNCTSADGEVTSDYARIQYLVEGHDLRGIDWGKAGSKDHLTLSFWVKTNATGDYHVSIENSNSSYFPLMVKKYTIDKANVWKKVVVTFPPFVDEYTFERGNGRGMAITWALATGSSFNGATDGVWRTSGYVMSTSTQRNFMDTDGNNFYITGVQLEKGKNATDFEHRPYGEELALCYRYFELMRPADRTLGKLHALSQAHFTVEYKTTKRDTPSVISNFSNASQIYDGTTDKVNGSGGVTFSYQDDGISIDSVTFRVNVSPAFSGSIYRPISGYGMTIAIDAEL